MRPTTYTDDLVNLAAKLTHQGYTVHSLDAARKYPTGDSQWQQQRSTDLNTVAGNLLTGRHDGLGINTHNLLVVDSDDHAAILQWQTEHREKGFAVSGHPVDTPRGRHYYFRCRPGAEWANGTKLWGAAIDVRGLGGQVVAPGTIRPDGGRYVGTLPDWSDLPWAPPPPDRLTHRGTVTGRQVPIPDDVVDIRRGLPHDGGTKYLCPVPSHGDRHGSLSIRWLDADDFHPHAHWSVKCFAGCATWDVLHALNLTHWCPTCADDPQENGDIVASTLGTLTCKRQRIQNVDTGEWYGRACDRKACQDCGTHKAMRLGLSLQEHLGEYAYIAAPGEWDDTWLREHERLRKRAQRAGRQAHVYAVVEGYLVSDVPLHHGQRRRLLHKWLQRILNAYRQGKSRLRKSRLLGTVRAVVPRNPNGLSQVLSKGQLGTDSRWAVVTAGFTAMQRVGRHVPAAATWAELQEQLRLQQAERDAEAHLEGSWRILGYGRRNNAKL